MAHVDQVIAASLAALSGVAIATLGVWVLSMGARGRAPVAFALFSVLWGSFLVLRNLPRFWSPPTVPPVWFWAVTLLVAALYVPLLVFVRSYPTRRGLLGTGAAGVWWLAVPLVLVAIAVVVRPLWFGPGEPVSRPTFGAWWLPVSTAGSVLAFAVALFFVHRGLREAWSETARAQSRILEFGFLPYVAHRSAQILVDQALGAQGAAASASVGVQAFVVAIGVVAFVVSLWVVVDGLGRERTRAGPALVGLGGLAFVVGGVETWMHHGGLPAPDTVGLWRFVMVAAFAFGIARYRVFDLELRLRGSMLVGAFGLVSVVALQVLADALGPSISERPAAAVLATAGVELGLVVAAFGIRRAWPSLADPERARSSLEKRRAEVYRAAVDAALVDGVITTKETEILRALRLQLGVSDSWHEHYVGSVLRGDARTR